MSKLDIAAIQTSLFGWRHGKSPFFSKSENISGSLYYAVIEALWKLSSVYYRKAFFKKAKTLWVTKYSTNEMAWE